MGFYLRNLQIVAFCILMSFLMESELNKMSVDSFWRVDAVIIETVEALETRYSIILSGSSVIVVKPITLSLSSLTIQSVNNNPWRH